MTFANTEFPSDWQDDTRMNFLFSPFKEKYVNPEGWEAKMNFWTSLIQQHCLKRCMPMINLNMLCSEFERKGRQPQCLDVVLDHMMSQNLIINIGDFSKVEPEKGWLGWGFDIVIQKPVTWGFSTVQSLLKWAKKDERFVVLSVIKNLAVKILHRHNELVKSEIVDNILFLDAFEEQCKDISSGLNFNLAIIQLQKEHSALVFEDNGRKVIKFRKSGEQKVQQPSETDKGVLGLQKARDSLLHDIDQLEEDIKKCTKEIKQMVSMGCQTKAMVILKRRKRLELCLTKKSTAFDNIESLLCQLQNSGSEKMVLDAYKIGVVAMKSSMKVDLNIDKIDVTMSEVEEAVDDYSEIQKTLSRPVVVGDESLEDFEDELSSLLASETPSPAEETSAVKPKTKEYSPSREILRRLDALRTPPEDVPPIKKPAVRKALLA